MTLLQLIKRVYISLFVVNVYIFILVDINSERGIMFHLYIKSNIISYLLSPTPTLESRRVERVFLRGGLDNCRLIHLYIKSVYNMSNRQSPRLIPVRRKGFR